VGRPDFLVIGHLSKDLTGDSYRLGGTAAYSALTARNLGRKPAIITSASPDLELRRSLRGIELVCIPSPATTTFVNIYEAEQRCQYIKAVAESIGADSIPPVWKQTPIVHLGPIVGEFEEDLIELFPSSIVGLTPQGYLRKWDDQGLVSPRLWTRAGRFLPTVDALIVSEDDLAGESGALRSQLGLPGVAVVTRGADGATLYHQGKAIHLAPRKTRVLDPTGAGDVFAAAFLVRLEETENPREAARFANAAASLSVEKAGIASAPERAEIEAALSDTP
jgi:sugar/nucleoside kinase (ribokinase family)